MNEMWNRNERPQRRRQPNDRQNGSSGNAARNYARYLVLAREATQSGDAIEAENCYQHAEHYFRVMQESKKGETD